MANTSTYPTDETTRQLCTCRVGPLHLGLDVLDIHEVMQDAGRTRIPGTAEAVTGLVNLRGQIATTIDLRARLGVEPSPDSEEIQIVVRYRGEPVGLLVDDVGDVILVDHSSYEPPPQNMAGPVRKLLTGAYKLDGRLLLTLDLDRTIATSNDPVNNDHTEDHR